MWKVVRRLIGWLILVTIVAVVAVAFDSCQQDPSYSGDKAFDVDTANIGVDVLPDARLRVTERLTFKYRGSFTGAYRDIPVQSGAELSGVSVSDPVDGTYQPGGDTILGSSDLPGKYGVTQAPDGSTRIVWHYSPQQDGERTFTVRYTLTGVAKAYDDGLVVPWAVWGSQWRFWLNHLHARITVRGKQVAAEHVWMGPRDLGVEPKTTSNGATLDLERAKPGTQVTLTALFPRSAVSSTDGAMGLPGQAVASTDQFEDARVRNSIVQRVGSALWPIWGALLALWTLLLGAVAMWFYRRSREHDSGVGKHFPGPPEQLPPAVGYALANEGRYDERVVLATLLDLVDRGYYKADPTEGKELDLRLAVAAPRPDVTLLKPYEHKVLDFFDGLLAAGGPCELGKLKDRIPKHSSTWRSKWEAMNTALDAAGTELITWDRDMRGARLQLAIAGVVGYLIIGVPVWMRTGFFAPAVAGAVAGLGIVFLLPSEWLTRRDEKAIVIGDQWAAFARWTKDFPNLDDDPPATLALWRRILVYAVAFGTAERVIKSGRIPAPIAEQDHGWSRGMMYGYSYGAFSGSSFSSGFSSQVAPQSSSSSGGGGGGGFSGGGGGGAW